MSTAYQLFNLPKAVALDDSANIRAGAKLEFFATGTTTHQDTYTDAALTTPSSNPVVAAANGVFAPIYLDPSLMYKVTYTNAAGVLVYTIDPCNDQVVSQTIIGDVLYPQTATEITDGLTPVNTSYEYGDVRRYDDALAFQGANWFCFGQAATRVSDTAFTVPGNYTSRYYFTSRVRLTDNAGGVCMGRVRNSTFAAGVTRVVVGTDSNTGLLGNIPATITSLCREEMPSTDGTNCISYSGHGSGTGTIVWNRDTDATAVGDLEVCVGQGASSTDASGETIYGASAALAIRAVPTTRTDSLLNGGSGYGGGGVGGAGGAAVIHTGLPLPIILGTADQERLIIPGNNAAIQFRGGDEALRLVAERTDDLGAPLITFFENDGTTRKGYVGFSNPGTNNTFEIANEESATNIKVSATQHIWLSKGTGASHTIYIDAAASTGIFTGSGSPNGVVTANPGSIYHNTSGGAAVTTYEKESGLGTNTGWVAL